MPFKKPTVHSADSNKSKPNFILVRSRSMASNVSKSVIFNDFLPSASSELDGVITNSKEGLRAFVLSSVTFVTAALSLFNQIVNSVAYQSYLFAVATWDQISAVPGNFGGLKDELMEFLSSIVLADTRELWWIEFKLDSKRFSKKIQHYLGLAFQVTKKFYLSMVVMLCIGLLNYGLVANISSTSASFVGRFINNNSVEIEAAGAPQGDTFGVLNQGAITLRQASPVKMILEYEVQEGDTLVKLSDRFGISKETIKFNNGIENDLEAGSKVYLPWLDGYIYNTDGAEKADDIASRYGVDAGELKKINRAVMNPENDTFDSGTLVLVAITDFGKVTEVNNKVEADKQAKIEAERRATLAAQSVSYSIASTPAPAANSAGFVWPTSGSISRCYSAGHRGCDIANRAGPDVVAVQGGTVSAVYYYTVYGYGLAVVVDHGNGLQTLYAHLSNIYVSQGQSVGQGQALGRMGCTGLCTGTHLHFEVRNNGAQVDPLAYLP